jgi:hypothetical protein
LLVFIDGCCVYLLLTPLVIVSVLVGFVGFNDCSVVFWPGLRVIFETVFDFGGGFVIGRVVFSSVDGANTFEK